MVDVLPAQGHAFLVFHHQSADDFLPLNKLLISSFSSPITGSPAAKLAKQKWQSFVKEVLFLRKTKKGVFKEGRTLTLEDALSESRG